MNLNRYLLIRMIFVGLLCWVLLSAYVVFRTSAEVGQALESDRKRLVELVEYFSYQRQNSPEVEGTPRLIGNQYGLLLAPYCLRYEGNNGQIREEGCDNLPNRPLIKLALQSVGIETSAESVEVGMWNQPFGKLQITADPARVADRFVASLKDLLLLTTLMLLALTLLTTIVVGRALRSATALVSQLDSIALSEDSPPPQPLQNIQPREFARIAEGMNRMSERLWHLTLARRQLLRQLMNVQEEERRELAHWIHADMGQALSILGVHCMRLKSLLGDADRLDEAIELLETLDEDLEHAFETMRSVLVNKCPPVLGGADLGLAIVELCTQWQIASGSAFQLTTALNEEGLKSLSKDQALCVYRTIEEALANVRRHVPHGAIVRVGLQRADQSAVELTVENSCGGQQSDSRVAKTGGMGLQLLAERVRVHHGKLSVARQADWFVIKAVLELGQCGQ